MKLAKEHQPPDGLRLSLDTALGSCLHFIKKREGHGSGACWQRPKYPSEWIQGGSKGRASVLLWLDAPTLARKKSCTDDNSVEEFLTVLIPVRP